LIDLFSAAGLSELVFLGIVIVTITGAVIATNSVRLIHSVTGLSICFIGVAGLYYYLNSPFVAMMEMLIYVGAVCVVIVFAVMLADPNPEQTAHKQNALAGAGAFLVGAMMFWGLSTLAYDTTWPSAAKTNNGSIMEIGKSLLTSCSMVFELISVVLLVAIIGSIIVARTGRESARRKE